MFTRRLRGVSLSSSGFLVPRCLGVGCRGITSRLDALDHHEKLEGCLSELPSKAKVVICGGGVMGAAVAYHLAKRGWGDQTIIVEKESVGAGSRWHASGLVGAFKPSYAQVRLAQSSIQLLKDLEARGRKTGWKQCGSLLLARNRDRMTVYRRMKSQSVSWGIDCELVTPKRCQELWPMLNVDDVIGGLWIPGDGVGDPHLVCMALAREAVENGVGVMEDCSVTAVHSKDGKVSGVETTQGAIECQYFVNCAGFWARKVGQLARPQVKVPLLPCEHYYLHTKPIDGLDPMTPVVRDPDGYIYLRERDGCMLAGGFEPVAKPVYDEEISTSSERCVAEDWDHFHVLLQQLLRRVPSLSQATLHKLCNGLEAFSPDCKWIVGEAPEVSDSCHSSHTLHKLCNGLEAFSPDCKWIVGEAPEWIVGEAPEVSDSCHSSHTLHKLCNGLEAFSPDCKWIVGEAPEVSDSCHSSHTLHKLCNGLEAFSPDCKWIVGEAPEVSDSCHSSHTLHKLCNGLEAFSPDCKWIVGEAPEVSDSSMTAVIALTGHAA
ncbi:FAD dependent oxidoreductase domain-containing protein [Phthorimaea operculella]|nr:FAD dependent oxidoreductase domain-containing protein [Phthorimaea operculella]